jgi:hypothetical protein
LNIKFRGYYNYYGVHGNTSLNASKIKLL